MGAPVSSSTSTGLPSISTSDVGTVAHDLERQHDLVLGGRRLRHAEALRVEEAHAPAREVEVEHVLGEELAAEQPVLPAGARRAVARVGVDPELQRATEHRLALVRAVAVTPDGDAELARVARRQDRVGGAGVEQQAERPRPGGRQVDVDAILLGGVEEGQVGEHGLRRDFLVRRHGARDRGDTRRRQAERDAARSHGAISF